MDILFVHEVNWLEKVTYEIHELPELLAARGHRVRFVDFPEARSLRGFRRLLDFRTESRLVEGRTVPSAQIEVVTPGRVMPPPLDRLLASLTFVPQLIRILIRDRPDILVVYSVPTNGWQTILLARIMRIPTLFRGMDVAHLIRKTKLAWLVRWSERLVYRKADWVSVNNCALKAYCISNGARTDRTSVEYAGLDVEHFRRRDDLNDLRVRYGISESDKVVVYMGTLFRFSGLDGFLREMAIRSSSLSGLKVLIVGDGELRPTLERICETTGIGQRVVFTGVVRYSELPYVLSLGDVAINTLVPQDVTNNAFPWKVAQYAATGLPTVSTPLAGLRALFPDGNGVMYASSPTEIWDRTLELLGGGEGQLAEMGRRSREIVLRSCNWTQNIDEFEQKIGRLVGQGL
jgi:glycosyltransferase involved in cell wall biosynthesis